MGRSGRRINVRIVAFSIIALALIVVAFFVIPKIVDFVINDRWKRDGGS